MMSNIESDVERPDYTFREGSLGAITNAVAMGVISPVTSATAVIPATSVVATQARTSEAALTPVAPPTSGVNWLLVGGIALFAWLLFSGETF